MGFLFKTSHKRTVFLAILAAMTFVGSAIFMFDVEKELIAEFFVVSVVGLLVIILLALLLTVIRLAVRRIFEK